jgi:hypothetical protein
VPRLSLRGGPLIASPAYAGEIFFLSSRLALKIVLHHLHLPLAVAAS